MTIVNGYCTLAELQEQFADQTTNKLSVPILERAVSATSRGIDNLCGFPMRRFWLDTSPTVRRYRVPEDPQVLFVADIGSSSGLTVETDSIGDGTFDTTWDAADYQLEPLDADLAGGPFAWTKLVAVGTKRFTVHAHRPTVRVTALHGWSAIPDDVRQACILRAAAIFKRRDAPAGFFAGGNIGGVDLGPVRITRRDADVWSLLHDYIRMSASPTLTGAG